METNQNSESGWIRLHRKMSDWQYYGLPNMMAVFIHLLLSANHRDGHVYGIPVKRGQILTSEINIMQSIKIKRGALRGVLNKLHNSGEIERVTTNKYSLITICNYENYQGEESECVDTPDIIKTEYSEQCEWNAFAPLVHVSKEEYNNLISAYGENGAKWMIKKLDDYKAATGKNYKSDYRAIQMWVVKEYKKEQNSGGTQITQSNGVSCASHGRQTKSGREHH